MKSQDSQTLVYKEFKRYVFCIHPLNLTFVNFIIFLEFRGPGPSLHYIIGLGSYRSCQEAEGPGPSLYSIICFGSYRSRQEAGVLDLHFILLSVQVHIDSARRLGALDLPSLYYLFRFLQIPPGGWGPWTFPSLYYLFRFLQIPPGGLGPWTFLHYILSVQVPIDPARRLGALHPLLRLRI